MRAVIEFPLLLTTSSRIIGNLDSHSKWMLSDKLLLRWVQHSVVSMLMYVNLSGLGFRKRLQVDLTVMLNVIATITPPSTMLQNCTVLISYLLLFDLHFYSVFTSLFAL